MSEDRHGDRYIKPSSISESITVFLRESILSGRFRPGEKINEREISERLGVSRSPIREALRFMAKEGLVTIVPHKGTVVSEISERELLELFEVREMIELYAIDLIERRADPDCEQMKSCLDLDVGSLEGLDINEYLSQVTRFHMAMVEASGNAMLRELYGVLCNSLRRYQLLAATIPARMELSIREHREILDAIVQARFERAKDLLRRHLEALQLKIVQEIDISKQDQFEVKGE